MIFQPLHWASGLWEIVLPKSSRQEFGVFSPIFYPSDVRDIHVLLVGSSLSRTQFLLRLWKS